MAKGDKDLDKRLERLADVLAIKIILDRFQSEEAATLLDLLRQDNIAAADKMILEKIPDLDKKVREEADRQVNLIYQGI